jgi:hypothetical protein
MTLFMFEHRSTLDNRIHFYETMLELAVSVLGHYDERGAISRSTLKSQSCPRDTESLIDAGRRGMLKSPPVAWPPRDIMWCPPPDQERV